MLLSSFAILLINISVMIFLVGGLSDTSIIWMIQIFLYKVLVCFLSPKRKPDLTKYMLWIVSVHLTYTSSFLHGPHHFDLQSDIIYASQCIFLCYWEFLLTSCNKLGIVPPLISNLTTTKPKKK